MTEFDIVERPQHYNYGGIETIDYIHALTAKMDPALGYDAGNVAKYISRAPHKNGLEDIRKARYYMRSLISRAGGKLRCFSGEVPDSAAYKAQVARQYDAECGEYARIVLGALEALTWGDMSLLGDAGRALDEMVDAYED